MFAKCLVIDDIRYSGQKFSSETRVVRNPDWHVIEDAVRSLDGKQVRMVLIGEREPPPDYDRPFYGCGLGIGGGGEDGLYMCIFYDHDLEEYRLEDPRKDVGDWRVIMYGQETHVWERACVDLDAVVSVATQFAVDGTLSKEWLWIGPSGKDPPTRYFGTSETTGV